MWPLKSSYDNALAQTINGLYDSPALAMAELRGRRVATLTWVGRGMLLRHARKAEVWPLLAARLKLKTSGKPGAVHQARDK